MGFLEAQGGSRIPANDDALEAISRLIEVVQPGSLVTKFIIIAETIDEDGEANISSFTTPGLRRWDSMGLLEFGMTMERNVTVGIVDDDEGGD